MSGWVDYESSPFAICFINMRDSNDFHIFQILPENHEVIPANADRPPEVSENNHQDNMSVCFIPPDTPLLNSKIGV